MSPLPPPQIGQTPSGSGLPGAVEGGEGPIPLVLSDGAGRLRAQALIRPQFARARPALRTRTPTFTLVSAAQAQFDPGDGSGMRELAPGETVGARYEGGTEATLMLRCDGRVAHCRLPISDDPAPKPFETWKLQGGTAWMLPAPDRQGLRSALVVVEGFPGGHGFLFSHDLLSQHGLLGRLRKAGYDLVVVGLDDGTRSVLFNAKVVEECLAKVRAQTTLPITLLGWSMGGLLARVALSSIEARGEEHHVERLITWDTPHRGSMTQLGVQYFVLRFADSQPGLVQYRQLLRSDANREMDMLVVADDGSVAVDPRRGALLAALSWPQRPRRVLLSSGRGDGHQSLKAGSVLLQWRATDGRSALTLRAMGTDQPILSGSLDGQALPEVAVPGSPAWDGMPGGREEYVAHAAAVLRAAGGALAPIHSHSTCTVPTVSALDLDTDPDTPVPDSSTLIVNGRDLPHLMIDESAATQLGNQIGAPFDPDAFDPRDPAFLADPYPAYRLFREYAPLHRMAAYDSVWCFRADDCETITKGTAVWTKHPPGGDPVPQGPTAALATLPPGLFSSDPPAHTGLRQAVEAAIGPALAQLPALATARAKNLLGALLATGRVEFVQDFALPLPANVLFDVLGIKDDPAVRLVLIGWQSAIATAHDAAQPVAVRLQGATCSMALRTFFAGLVHAHRRAPAQGLVGTICDAFATHGIGDDELVATLCDLLIAGYLSTTFLLANGVWRLLQAPAIGSELRSDRSKVPAAVEELLRLDAPAQVVDRVAAVDTSLGGLTMPAGTKVTAVLGSANRDPSRFGSPDELRLTRQEPSLAFGSGVHACVGAPIVRAVAPAALEALFDLTTTIELDGDPQWQSDPYLRGVVSLPLRLS